MVASVAVAVVDPGDTGEQAEAAAAHGIRLEVIELPTAKRGFVLLLRTWVVERSFGWTTCFRRLVRDDERLLTTGTGLHVVDVTSLMLHRLVTIVGQSP
jgi:transposase